MSDYTLFAVSIVLIVLVWGGYSLRNVNIKEYFKTRTGKGILKGIVLAILFALVFSLSSALFAQEGKWLSHAEVYAGLDATKKVNPMCDPSSEDAHSGSNIGLKLNIYEQGRFSASSQYVHHSCGFGRDLRSYDALGIELKYRFWQR